MYAENDSTIKIEGAIKKSFQVKKYCETEDFKNEECEQESGKYLLHFTRHGVMKEKEEQKITWTCEADIPHETFVIYKGGEPYCRGIVFSIDDVWRNLFHADEEGWV